MAERLVGALLRRKKQYCQEFLNGLLQEHWVALDGHEKSVNDPAQGLSLQAQLGVQVNEINHHATTKSPRIH